MEQYLEQKIMKLVADIINHDTRIWELEMEQSRTGLSDKEVSMNEDMIFAHRSSLERKIEILKLFKELAEV